MKKQSTHRAGPLRAIHAAGGVVFDAQGRVAIVHRPRYDDWCLPKGKLERGEDAIVAAVREVWEEACCLATPQAFVGSLCYEVKGRPKWVFYWLMHAEQVLPFESCGEVDEVAWLTPAAVVKRLVHRGEREMLARAVKARR